MGRQPELFETGGLQGRERLADEVGQGGSAPKSEGFVEEADRTLGVRGRQGAAALVDQSLKAPSVDALRVDGEDIAGCLGTDAAFVVRAAYCT